MKFRMSFVLLALGLAASSAVTAHASCNNFTIKGSYAFTIHGQIFTPNGPLLVDGIANQDSGEIYGGVVLVGALALSSEGVFALLQRLLTSPGLRRVAAPGRVEISSNEAGAAAQ